VTWIHATDSECSEHGREIWNFLKGEEFHYQLNDCQLLKKKSVRLIVIRLISPSSGLRHIALFQMEAAGSSNELHGVIIQKAALWP
jgi:hypothetical protein